MDIAKLEFYIKKKLAGTDYSELRQEMQADGMSQEEIDLMVPEIDAAVLEIALAKRGRSISAKTLVGWGIILLSTLAFNRTSSHWRSWGIDYDRGTGFSAFWCGNAFTTTQFKNAEIR